MLLEDGNPFAGVEPNGEKRCTGHDLAEALAKVELSVEEAQLWYRGSQAARQTLNCPDTGADTGCDTPA